MSYAEIEILKYWQQCMKYREVLKKTYTDIPKGVFNTDMMKDYQELARFSDSNRARYDEIRLTSSLMTDIDDEYQKIIMSGILLYPTHAYEKQTLEEYIQEINDTNINVYDANKRMLAEFDRKTRYRCMIQGCPNRARFELGVCHECQEYRDR
jgi:hypothetical protein